MDRFITLSFSLLNFSIVFNRTESTSNPETNKAFMHHLNDENHKKASDEFFKSKIMTNNVFKNYTAKDPPPQFIAAARVSVVELEDSAYHLKLEGNKVLFWRNLNWQAFIASGDCNDVDQCQKPIRNLQTRGLSTAMEANDGKSTVHTELQMLYGNRGRINLMEPAKKDSNIIIMYSRMVPCSQLGEKSKGTACYGECSGDMKNYRANDKTGLMIISIYSGVHKDERCHFHSKKKANGNCFETRCLKKTNEQVSNLYLEIGGIPSYQVDIENGIVLKNPGFTDYIDDPSNQMFPRLTFARGFDKQRRLVKCIVEDNDLLWRIMGERGSVIDQFNHMRGNANAESMPDYRIREVIYRYISYKFVKVKDVRRKLERTALYNKLSSFFKKLFRKRYDVCLRYARYYDFGGENIDQILKVKESPVMDIKYSVNWHTVCDLVISQLNNGIFSGDKVREENLCKSLFVLQKKKGKR